MSIVRVRKRTIAWILHALILTIAVYCFLASFVFESWYVDWHIEYMISILLALDVYLYRREMELKGVSLVLAIALFLVGGLFLP